MPHGARPGRTAADHDHVISARLHGAHLHAERAATSLAQATITGSRGVLGSDTRRRRCRRLPPAHPRSMATCGPAFTMSSTLMSGCGGHCKKLAAEYAPCGWRFAGTFKGGARSWAARGAVMTPHAWPEWRVSMDDAVRTENGRLRISPRHHPTAHLAVGVQMTFTHRGIAIGRHSRCSVQLGSSPA